MENCQKRTEKRQLKDEQHSLQQEGSEAHSNLDECRKSEILVEAIFSVPNNLKLLTMRKRRINLKQR